MESQSGPAWDGRRGTAGGPAFGLALRGLIAERGIDTAGLTLELGADAAEVEALLEGKRRIAVAELARLARALRLGPVEFMQKSGLLSLETYALGLDPLYFLPAGDVRKDARIYMREINPRHRVPERDMFVRNPALRALEADEILDPLGKLELALTYLLRAAVQETGGTL